MRQSKETNSTELSSYILNPSSVAHLHSRNWMSKKNKQANVLLYHQTLKERFVLFALKKLVEKAKNHEQNIANEVNEGKYKVGEDEQNAFLKRGMKKRVVNNKIKKGTYYSTIEPTPSYVKNLRKLICEVSEIIQLFDVRGYLFQYRKAVSLKSQKSPRGNNISLMMIDSRSSRVHLKTVASNTESVGKQGSPPSIFTEQKSSLPRSKYKLQRNITQMYMLKSTNKEINSFAHQNSEIQEITMKNIIKAVHQKATMARKDLKMIQRWISQLRPGSLTTLNQIQVQSNKFIRLLLRKLSGIVLASDEIKLRSNQSEHTSIANSRISYMLSKSTQELISEFRQLHSELTFVSNRYIYSDSHFPRMSGFAFQELLTLSSKVRYVLGFLHKQVQQILTMLEDNCSQVVETFSENMEQQRAENTRIINLAKSIKKKYNMEFTSNIILEGLQKSKSVYFQHSATPK